MQRLEASQPRRSSKPQRWQLPQENKSYIYKGRGGDSVSIAELLLCRVFSVRKSREHTKGLAKGREKDISEGTCSRLSAAHRLKLINRAGDR